MKKKPIYIINLVVAFTFFGCNSTIEVDEKTFPDLKGDYFGQILPEDNPELFAPDLISTGMYERDMAISPDGNEMFYTVMSGTYSFIVSTKLKNGVWTEPDIASFSGDSLILDAEPHISPDGKQLLFLSTRPLDNMERKSGWYYQNIWVVDKQKNGWGEPYPVGIPINSDDPAYFPSIDKNGILYFVRSNKETGKSLVYQSFFKEGRYLEPEVLPKEVNHSDMQYNTCISPDGDYMIVCTSLKKDKIGKTDYCISFKDGEGAWTPLMNMGQKINKKGMNAISPYISPDGKFFFFAHQRLKSDKFEKKPLSLLKSEYCSPQNGNSDIYWISTAFIEELKNKAFSK